MMTFNEDELEVIKDLILEYGSDCPSTDWKKVEALGIKLGCLVEPLPPTAEELKRREAMANSPLNKQMQEFFATSNKWFAEIEAQKLLESKFFDDSQWTVKTKIGSNLKIKLPIYYNVKDNK